MIAFFDSANPDESYWINNYKDKTVTITWNDVTFNATIKDTCGDSDCNGCCTKNAKPTGYLIDMEYYTVLRNFGSTDPAEGAIQFTILDTQAQPNDALAGLAGGSYVLLASLLLLINA